MNTRLFRKAALAGLLLGTTAVVTAQSGLPGSGWYTTAVIQNVSPEAGNATVDIEVFPQGTGTSSTATFDVAQNASRVFFPGSGGAGGNVDVSPTLGTNFVGSMVVSASKEVVAVGQVTNFAAVPGVGTQGGFASAQYRGADATSASISYPAVKSNFGNKTTIFAVQAAGAQVNYTATIRDSAGGTHSKTGTIGANRSVTLIPSDFSPAMATTNCGSDPNTSPCFGSLAVTATGGNIVGAYVETFTTQSPATVAQAASMFASTDAGSTALCPVIKADFGTNRRTTGTTVANVGSSAVDVTGVFTVAQSTSGVAVGTEYRRTARIEPGKSFVFGQLNQTVGGMPAGNLAAARFTANGGSIVAITSESNFGTTPQKQTVYTCFNPDTATTKAAAPVVKRNFGNNTTGITVQNANATGTAPITVNATYICGNNTYGPIASRSLRPGESDNTTFFQPAGVPVNNLCSVTLTAGAATNKIIAIANESSDVFPGTVQFNLDTKNYEAFNVQ